MRTACAALLALALFLVVVGAAAEGAAETEADAAVRASWQRAEVWIAPRRGPFTGGPFRGRLDEVEMRRILGRLPAGERLPTVLLLHGCAHVKQAAWTYARRLALAGYAVLIPDSFAGGRRPAICNRWNREPIADAPVERVHARRMAELAHAAAAIGALPWVDPRNLFLLGHEDGGDAAALYDGTLFRAVALSASACRRGWRVRPEVPVLVLAAERDPARPEDRPRACVEQAGAGATVTFRLVPGVLHDLSGDRAAREALLAFFAAHRGG